MKKYFTPIALVAIALYFAFIGYTNYQRDSSLSGVHVIWFLSAGFFLVIVGAWCLHSVKKFLQTSGARSADANKLPAWIQIVKTAVLTLLVCYFVAQAFFGGPLFLLPIIVVFLIYGIVLHLYNRKR